MKVLSSKLAFVFSRSFDHSVVPCSSCELHKDTPGCHNNKKQKQQLLPQQATACDKLFQLEIFKQASFGHSKMSLFQEGLHCNPYDALRVLVDP